MSNALTVIQIIIGIALAILIPIVGWLFLTVINQKSDIQSLKVTVDLQNNDQEKTCAQCRLNVEHRFSENDRRFDDVKEQLVGIFKNLNDLNQKIDRLILATINNPKKP